MVSGAELYLSHNPVGAFILESFHREGCLETKKGNPSSRVKAASAALFLLLTIPLSDTCSASFPLYKQMSLSYIPRVNRTKTNFHQEIKNLPVGSHTQANSLLYFKTASTKRSRFFCVSGRPCGTSRNFTQILLLRAPCVLHSPVVSGG